MPLVAVYALVYDRQSQSDTAQAAINAGWGGPQIVAGPVVAVAGVGTLGYAGVFGACAVLVAAGLGLLVLGYVRRVRSATSRSLAT